MIEVATLALLTGGSIVAAAWVVAFRTPRTSAARGVGSEESRLWRPASRALGLELDAPGKLSGRIDGYPIAVDTTRDGAVLRVVIGGLPRALALHSPPSGDGGVSTGDDVFDRVVETQMPPAELGWLPYAVRDAVSRCGALRIAGGELHLERARPGDAGAIVEVVEAALAVVRVLPTDPDPVRKLAALITGDPIPGVRLRALRHLARLSPQALHQGQLALSDPDVGVRMAAAELFGDTTVTVAIATDNGAGAAARGAAFRALDPQQHLASIPRLADADGRGLLLAADTATTRPACDALALRCDDVARRLDRSSAHHDAACALVAAALRNRHAELADASVVFLAGNRALVAAAADALAELGTPASLPALRQAARQAAGAWSTNREAIRAAIAAIEDRGASPKGALALAAPGGHLALAPRRPDEEIARRR